MSTVQIGAHLCCLALFERVNQALRLSHVIGVKSSPVVDLGIVQLEPLGDELRQRPMVSLGAVEKLG